jgi:glycosyltransferase involved in cell wall biosynthesis
MRANSSRLVGSKQLALFSPSLRAGGAEQVMVTLANGLAERGVRVTLLLARCEGPFLTQVDPAVRVVDLNAKKVSGSIFALARYLRRECPAALLSFQTHANLIAIAARSLARVPVRLVVSERSSLTGSGAQTMGFKNRVVRLLSRAGYRKADAISVVAEAMVDEVTRLARLPAGRVVCIPNPIITPAMPKLADEPTDHPFARRPGPPLIVSAGRLAPEKDFPTLLRAFAILRRQLEAKLLILGEGSSRSVLEALVRELELENDVDLPGFRPNPFPYLKSASLYVLSSKFEGLPGSLIQAMAVGTPVVSTDCRTGPAEILEGGRWGKLVPVGGTEALAAAMLETLESDTHPDVASRAQFYSLERAISGYSALLGLDE